MAASDPESAMVSIDEVSTDDGALARRRDAVDFG